MHKEYQHVNCKFFRLEKWSGIFLPRTLVGSKWLKTISMHSTYEPSCSETNICRMTKNKMDGHYGDEELSSRSPVSLHKSRKCDCGLEFTQKILSDYPRIMRQVGQRFQLISSFCTETENDWKSFPDAHSIWNWKKVCSRLKSWRVLYSPFWN